MAKFDSENLEWDNASLLKENSNLKSLLLNILKDIKDGTFNHNMCYGCGRDMDEPHKADCLIDKIVQERTNRQEDINKRLKKINDNSF